MTDWLSIEEVGRIKGAFIENRHPHFKKELAVSRHQPFGKTSDYVKCIDNADSAKIAKLVKLVGMLLQAKAYLFWIRMARKERGLHRYLQ